MIGGNDSDGQWTFGLGGDDLPSEDTGTCPTAIRDGFYQLGQDCMILDLDASLSTPQPVDRDLEDDFPFSQKKPGKTSGRIVSRVGLLELIEP